MALRAVGLLPSEIAMMSFAPAVNPTNAWALISPLIKDVEVAGRNGSIAGIVNFRGIRGGVAGDQGAIQDELLVSKVAPRHRHYSMRHCLRWCCY
jgi:hypothetical protein